MLSSKEIQEQFAVVRTAPVPFFVAVFAAVSIAIVAINLAYSWAHNAILSSKSSQIELLDRQISDYKDKLNGASPSDAKARIDTLEARKPRRTATAVH